VTAQHVVSGRRLRRMPLAFYRQLLGYLLAPPGHFIHEDVRQLEPAARAFFEREAQREGGWNNNPFFGHVLERAWSLIFDCHRPEQLLPCWCSEDVEPCAGDSCQCTDEETGPAGAAGLQAAPAGWGAGGAAGDASASLGVL
jgi:hypothetical protein